MRSLSSCFEATLIWRRTERANLQKKPSMRLSQGAVLRREGELEAASGSSGKPSFGFFRYVCGMIIGNQLDRGSGRIEDIEKLEELDELSATRLRR
jgi:hypothetical protein